MAKSQSPLKTAFSVFLWLLLSFVTVLFASAIILTSFLLRLVDPDRRVAHRIACAWGRTFFFLNPGWKLKVQGRGYLRKTKNYILVANHNSMSDIMAVFVLYRQFKWVAKDNLFKIPFFGWAMSALHYVRLVRGQHGSIRTSFDQARNWLKRPGISVLFFPEGTRSRTGELGNFKNGAFKLAIETKIPIVPIVLTGTFDAIQKGSFLLAPRVNCKMKVLKPIPTAELTSKQVGELSARVRLTMQENLK